MKYSEFRTPWDVVKQMRDDYGWEKAGQIAYQHFFENYFKPIPDEKVKIIKRFKFLMPGRLYTFSYDPLYKNELDYYDKRPIMLCIKSFIHPKTGNNLQLGINMNFIPAEMRVFIVEGLWKWFEPMIKQDLGGRPPKEGEINRQKLLFTDNFDVYGLLEYVLDTVGKTHFKFAIRQYIWERIENAKWVDYNVWGYLPLLRANDLVGVSERELAKLYWKDKNKKFKK